MKYRVAYVKDKLPNGFVGMNWWSAKEIGIPFPYSKNTIIVWKGLGSKARKHTIAHEKDEVYWIRRGKHYHEAHKKALSYEKYNVPFPDDARKLHKALAEIDAKIGKHIFEKEYGRWW